MGLLAGFTANYFARWRKSDVLLPQAYAAAW
jgi:hypothetical protein